MPDELSHTRETTATSPIEALNLEEVARVRIFFRSIVITCVVAGAALPFLDGDPSVEYALWAALALCALSSGQLYWLLDDPTTYDDARAARGMLFCALVANLAVVYWGIFSAAQVGIVILLYVFSRSRSAIAAVSAWAICAIIQGACAALFTGGWYTDPGLFTAESLSFGEKMITHGIGQMVFAFTFWSGRLGRRASLDAIGKLESAVRQISKREAQLREVRHELDLAMGVGGPGRYTSLTLSGYRIGNVLGRGAMGEVYEGRHVDTGDEVAVKVMRVESLDDPVLLERFVREAEAASKLASRHVVRVLPSSPGEESLPFLVMERLHGLTLAEHLRRRGRLAFDMARTLALQVGSVVDDAGNGGIVHRDLKPQNLMLVDEGGESIWKVLDFGVSRLTEGSGTLTRGDVVGTPAYMAPEQARGEVVDTRADVYALGAILYRALTGVPPFQSAEGSSALFQVVFTAPVRPSALAVLSPDVDAFFAVALAKRPGARFETGAALSAAFEAALDDELGDALHVRARALLDDMPWRDLLDEPTAVTVPRDGL